MKRCMSIIVQLILHLIDATTQPNTIFNSPETVPVFDFLCFTKKNADLSKFM